MDGPQLMARTAACDHMTSRIRFLSMAAMSGQPRSHSDCVFNCDSLIAALP
jgi:hypothetical protein